MILLNIFPSETDALLLIPKAELKSDETYHQSYRFRQQCSTTWDRIKRVKLNECWFWFDCKTGRWNSIVSFRLHSFDESWIRYLPKGLQSVVNKWLCRIFLVRFAILQMILHVHNFANANPSASMQLTAKSHFHPVAISYILEWKCTRGKKKLFRKRKKKVRLLVSLLSICYFCHLDPTAIILLTSSRIHT